SARGNGGGRSSDTVRSEIGRICRDIRGASVMVRPRAAGSLHYAEHGLPSIACQAASNGSETGFIRDSDEWWVVAGEYPLTLPSPRARGEGSRKTDPRCSNHRDPFESSG